MLLRDYLLIIVMGQKWVLEPISAFAVPAFAIEILALEVAKVVLLDQNSVDQLVILNKNEVMILKLRLNLHFVYPIQYRSAPKGSGILSREIPKLGTPTLLDISWLQYQNKNERLSKISYKD